LRAIGSIARAEAGRGAALAERARSVLDLRYVALITTLGTYALIVLGGTVRVTGSGLACPDWPLCHGELIPPLQEKVLIEYAHRLVASVVGILLLATFAAAWLGRRANPVAFWATLGAGLVLALQIGLGGITVLSDNSAESVATHLSVALSLLALLIFVTVVAFRPVRRGALARPHDAFTLTAAATALVLFALILTGSFVANTGASLAYRDWPLFDGSLLANGTRLGELHYAHRVLAAFSGLLVLAVVARAWRAPRQSNVVLGAVLAATALYVAQVFLGAGNIWFDLAQSVRVAHLAVASATWALLVFAAISSYLDHAAASEGAA
jgi:heme A synthase